MATRVNPDNVLGCFYQAKSRKEHSYIARHVSPHEVNPVRLIGTLLPAYSMSQVVNLHPSTLRPSGSSPVLRLRSTFAETWI